MQEQLIDDMQILWEQILQEQEKILKREITNSFEQKFGVDSEPAKHAQELDVHSMIAKPFQNEQGQLMTTDEFNKKYSVSWDEFNHMGGLTQEQSQQFMQSIDPFGFQHEPTIKPQALDQDTKDIITAINYQVENYPKMDNFPIEPEPLSKEQTKSAIQAMREPETVVSGTGEQQAQHKPVFTMNPTKAVETDELMVKQDNSQFEQLSPEMMKEAMQSSQFISDANFVEQNQKAAFPTVTKRRTISPNDEKLSVDAMFNEMNDNTFKSTGVNGDEKTLVNYFDKTRAFEFGGKSAETQRADCVEKKDLKGWLDTFQPPHAYMKEQQALEKSINSNMTDDQEKTLGMKHKFEQKFFDVAERHELSKASDYFPNELKERLPQVKPVTKDEIKELHDSFRDYASQRLGKSWKNEYADPKQDPYNQKNIKKEKVVFNMGKQQKEINQVKTHEQVKSRIKSLSFSM